MFQQDTLDEKFTCQMFIENQTEIFLCKLTSWYQKSEIIFVSLSVELQKLFESVGNDNESTSASFDFVFESELAETEKILLFEFLLERKH